MPGFFTNILRDWQCFYQVLGESSATLNGLMFFSISIGARLLTPKTVPLIRTFITPILGYLLIAFTISALMCFLKQARLGLAAEIGLIGLIGLWRSLLLLQIMRRYGEHLHLEHRHWVWHLVLPSLGTLCLMVAAGGLWFSWPLALDVLALVVLLLVVTSVVNAWEIAMQAFQTPPDDTENL